MKLVVFALLLSLAGNAVLAYLLINAGISLDHSRAQNSTLEKRAAVCLDAVNFGWRGRTDEEISNFSKFMVSRGVPSQHTGSVFSIGEIEFYISGGVVSSAKYMNP